MVKVLTFLATRQLRSLSTNLGVEAVGERLDKLEDIGTSTGLFDFLLRDF